MVNEARFIAVLWRVATREQRWSTLAVVGILVLSIRRWSIVGPYPPGLDGAQWLAIGRGMHGFGRSTQGAYAPLAPFVATLADALLGPLPAVRSLAVLSTVLLSLSVWLVARYALGPVWGLAATFIAVPASALAEPTLYGGYPQQLALAGGLMTLGAATNYLTSDETRSLGFAGLAAFFAAAAHHIYFPLTMLSLATIVLCWCSAAPRDRRLRTIAPLAIAIVPACMLFATVAFSFMSRGYAAPLDASASDPFGAWHYATRESPLLWLGLLALAAVSLVLQWKSRGTPSWLLSAGLIGPAGVLLITSGQPRLAPPLLVGCALASAAGAQALVARCPPLRPAIALATLMAPVVLLLPADREAVAFAEYYRVVDGSLIGAAEAIANDLSVGTIAVRQDRRGWPIGWWLEALQDRPVLVGSDPRWLGFPDERRQAAEAASLFDGHLAAETFREQADALNVRFLVTPKWDWIGWERWLDDPEFPVSILYDDDRYLVLRVRD